MPCWAGRCSARRSKVEIARREVPVVAVKKTHKRFKRRKEGLTTSVNEMHPGADIDLEAMTFGNAMREWQRVNKVRFPSCRDILTVVKAMGYRLVAPAKTG